MTRCPPLNCAGRSINDVVYDKYAFAPDSPQSPSLSPGCFLSSLRELWGILFGFTSRMVEVPIPQCWCVFFDDFCQFVMAKTSRKNHLIFLNLCVPCYCFVDLWEVFRRCGECLGPKFPCGEFTGCKSTWARSYIRSGHKKESLGCFLQVLMFFFKSYLWVVQPLRLKLSGHFMK